MTPNPSAPSPSGSDRPCPLCLKPGREIPRSVLFQHLDSGGITYTLFWKKSFACLQYDCECLYYYDRQWVSHQHCNKKVGFKDVPPPHILCYCFGYSGEEILKSGGLQGNSPILEEIRAYLEKGGHLCEKTNPSGQKCLDAIRDFLRRHGPGQKEPEKNQPKGG